MDRATRAVLGWVNVRRAWLDRPELDDLLAPEPGDAATDPITASLGATWCLSRIQVETPTGIGQYEVPEHLHHWLATWRAGRYPQYDP